MFGENSWKVLVLVTGLFLAQAIDSPGRKANRIYTGVARYPVANYRGTPMFVPRNRYRGNQNRKSRVLFLDDEESTKQFARGVIDLTSDNPDYGLERVKFDENTDFDFTSPEGDDANDEKPSEDYDKDAENPSGNERYYDTPSVPPRLRPTPFAQGFAAPKFYQGRFGRPYAPGFSVFDPYFPVSAGTPFSPSVRNGFYGTPKAPTGWKARSPRVVFPYTQDTGGNSLTFQSNAHQGGTGGAPTGSLNFNNDNVIFRDQNFGLNDVSSSDDLALQDLGEAAATGSDSFAERDNRAAGDPHQAKHESIKKRIGYSFGKSTRRPKYIPLTLNYYSTNNPLIPKDSTKILPPSIQYEYKYTNISKTIGDKRAFLPKFKPISDEQILKIDQILRELPARDTTEAYVFVTTAVPYVLENANKNKHRKGKILKEHNEDVAGSNHIEVSTEQNLGVTKDIERQDEKKCPQGGTCEFFIYCWMVGGLLEGSCGGLLKGCCHRVAKAGLLGVQDTNAIDYSTGSDGAMSTYGPVINDQSKSLRNVPINHI